MKLVIGRETEVTHLVPEADVRRFRRPCVAALRTIRAICERPGIDAADARNHSVPPLRVVRIRDAGRHRDEFSAQLIEVRALLLRDLSVFHEHIAVPRIPGVPVSRIDSGAPLAGIGLKIYGYLHAHAKRVHELYAGNERIVGRSVPSRIDVCTARISLIVRDDEIYIIAAEVLEIPDRLLEIACTEVGIRLRYDACRPYPRTDCRASVGCTKRHLDNQYDKN